MLARQGVLVQRLPAIQNLGSMTTLCTDKTGTFTEGRLTVERAIRRRWNRGPTRARARLAQQPLPDGVHQSPRHGRPRDRCPAGGTARPSSKMGELPFDFNRRCLSVLLARPDSITQIITKGAPEAILDRSTRVRTDGGTTPLDDAWRERIAGDLDLGRSGWLPHHRGRRPGRRSRISSWTRRANPASCSKVCCCSAIHRRRPSARPWRISRSLGVGIKVVTGDNDLVARPVAQQVGLAVDDVITGDEIQKLSHPAFAARAQHTTIFARVDPDQKLRVIRALHERGAVVGYLGDGINDAPSLHVADVGISVDNATDVARAAADVDSAAAEPRGDRAAASARGGGPLRNTLKYIRMGTSSNFGNMLSMAGAAVVLPFLPMLPSQILLNNLIYDASQIAIPTDGIDPETEVEPATLGHPRDRAVHAPVRAAQLDVRLPDLRLPPRRAERQGGRIPHRLVRRVVLRRRSWSSSRSARDGVRSGAADRVRSLSRLRSPRSRQPCFCR